MHDLVGPAYRAVGGIQRDDRIRMAVVAGPQSAVEVRARARSGHEDEPTLRVRRHRRPGVGVACHGRALALPVGIRSLAGYGVELPQQLAALHIERPDRAAWRLDPDVVRYRRPDHDRVADDDRRRRHLELAGPYELHADVEPHFAAVAERLAGGARRRIDRHEAAIVRAHENPRGALPGVPAPVGHTAADELVGRPLAEIDVGIESPSLPARPGVQGDHLVERRTEHETVADQDRSALGNAAGERAGLHFEVARGESPGDLEPGRVFRVDHRCGAEPVPAGVAAVKWPAFRRQRHVGAVRHRPPTDVEGMRAEQVAVTAATQHDCNRRRECQRQQPPEGTHQFRSAMRSERISLPGSAGRRWS